MSHPAGHLALLPGSVTALSAEMQTGMAGWAFAPRSSHWVVQPAPQHTEARSYVTCGIKVMADYI